MPKKIGGIMAILTAVLNWKVAGSIIPSVVSQSMLNNTWKRVPIVSRKEEKGSGL